MLAAKETTLTFFPTFVWVYDLQPADYTPLNEEIWNKVEAAMPPGGHGDIPHSLQSSTKLHKLPEFQPLVALAEKASESVLKFLEHEPSPMRVTGCWANVGAPGKHHIEHSHPNNFLSAVYYVKAPEGGDQIVFHDPRLQAHVIAPRIKKMSVKHASSVNITIMPGRMVVFPAWLRHSVNPNVSQDLRLSIAINLMFDPFTSEQSPPRFKGHFAIDDPDF